MTETIVNRIETLADGLTLTEGPRWHNGRLYFSDMHEHRVCSLGEGGRVETVASFDDKASGIGFLPDGDMLVVLMASARIMRVGKGGTRLHADIKRFADRDINDMVVAPSGRAYIGQIGFNFEKGEEPKSTCLVTVDLAGKAEVAAADLWCPNGIAVTPDGRRLITAESAANCLTAFDIDAAGQLSNRRVFAKLPGERQGPDGFCLDDKGGAWVAIPMNMDGPAPYSPGFIRVEEGGKITHRIPMAEGRYAVACVFGGPKRNQLYLCTGDDFTGEGSKAKRGGRIERIEVGFSGGGTP